MNSLKKVGEPLYIHNCDGCIFCGTYQERDLYYCPLRKIIRHERDFFIARFGNGPYDFTSGPASVHSQMPTRDTVHYMEELARIIASTERYDEVSELAEKIRREEEEAINSLDKCFRLVENFFQIKATSKINLEARFKTHLWFITENPGLGGLKPVEMVRVDKIEKLLIFIQTMLDSNYA